MSTVTVTDKAAEEVKKVAGELNYELDVTCLRVRVCGGGCSGFQHKLDLDSLDNVSEKMDILEELNGIKVAIDKRSALYLDGATIDYIDDGLMRRGFSVVNPAAKSTCGCGSSFNM